MMTNKVMDVLIRELEEAQTSQKQAKVLAQMVQFLAERSRTRVAERIFRAVCCPKDN